MSHYGELIERGEVLLSDTIAEMAKEADAKSTQKEARYTDGPVKDEPCKACNMFITSFACTTVQGRISPDGHCRFWEAKDQDGETQNQKSQNGQAAFDKENKSDDLVPSQEEKTSSPSRAEAAKTGLGYIDDVLNSDPTKHVINNAIINREHKVPYTAGGSVPLEDPEMFVDERFPREFELNGKKWDPADPFTIHENIEQHVMEILVKAGMPKELAYKCAHWGWAEIAEGAWYANQGINQAGAEQLYRPWMEKIQAEPGKESEFPDNLYRDPYPHDQPSAASGESLDEPLPTGEEMERAKRIVAEHLKKDVTGDRTIALDRASVRELDQDGRLHVEVTNISKAAVNPYLGKEIPGWEQLGLEPERVYKLLRDPKELARAADSFNNQPLLSQHIPVFAADYAEQAKHFIVGATGSDAIFQKPYLRNSLVIWDGAAVQLIHSGEQKEISCGYHYEPDMTPGIYEGEKYDGVMRNIVGNHVALVKEGRAGADVVVGDSCLARARARVRSWAPLGYL